MLLKEPHCVLEGTQGYKEENDITGRWIVERLVKAEANIHLGLIEACADYVSWYEDEIGGKEGKKFSIQPQSLSKVIEAAGFVKKKNRVGRTYFEGVMLGSPENLVVHPDTPIRNTTGLSEGLAATSHPAVCETLM
jgi:hypothetical protein